MARYRYKRGRRGYRRSTNSIMMKFQSFMDIRTLPNEMQIISINAGGSELLKRLPAQFSAYKYYKIGNISVKLVPASTLPVDPTGLSYEAGEQTVDPRDQLTPGMMRITNGEDIFEDLTALDATEQHQLYNAMMLDPRWFKWMLQRGVKRHATPKYWQIGQLHQDKWPGAYVNYPRITDIGTADQALAGTSSEMKVSGSTGFVREIGSSHLGLFQTGHKGVLGWLPTDGMQEIMSGNPVPLICSPPEIEVMKIVLPPAYKTSYYYRAYISETVYFREPKVMAIGLNDMPFRPLDVFSATNVPRPMSPTDIVRDSIPDTDTGGNYGSH